MRMLIYGWIQRHPARVVGDESWVAVALYCDEGPVLKKDLGKEDVEYPISIEQA